MPKTAQKPQQNAIETVPNDSGALTIFHGLRPVEIQAMELLLRGVSIEEIARQIGKSDNTIRNWREKPAWIRAWEHCKNDWRNRTLRTLQEGAEAVAAASVDSAIGGNTNAQRTVLETVGVLKSNSSAASSTNPLQAALAAISVNIRVESPKTPDIEVCDATDADIVSNQ